MNNMNQLLAQAKKLQENVAKTQQDLESTEINGAAGSNAVSITLTGSGKVKNIKINPSVVNPNDVDLLEDLILAAYNDARSKSEELYESEMKKATGGLSLPGMF